MPTKSRKTKKSRKPKRCSKLLVMRGKCKKTPGGLTEKDLRINKFGKIVSKRKSNPLTKSLRYDQAYCLHCRKAVSILNAVKKVVKAKYKATGKQYKRKFLRGKCHICKGLVSKTLPSSD